MNDIAEKLFDFLPDDGSKFSGGQVKEALGLSSLDYKAAKTELSLAGVVELGRGRGGTICRVLGAKKPESPPKISQAEKLAFARESRLSNLRERKKADKIRCAALEIAEKEFPDADKIDVDVLNFNGRCIIFPWYDGEAKAYGVWIDNDD